MTETDAIQAATQIAHDRNWPWDPSNVRVRTWRLWPFSRVWQIVSTVADGGAIATIRINGNTGALVFGRVRYPGRRPTETR